MSEQANHFKAEIIDIGEHLVPFEKSGAPQFHGADTASNADFAAVVRYDDAIEKLVEVFHEGCHNDETHYSFRGTGTAADNHELAVTEVDRGIINGHYDNNGTTPLPGMEIASYREAESLLQHYIIRAAIGAQALRANDYWIE